MNLTLAVDDRLVEQARKVAESQGKSLNQVIREYLEELISPATAAGEMEELRRLSLDLSTQVLQEYFVSAVRKLGVPVTVARRKVEIFSRFELVRIDADDILAAIDLHRLHQFHFGIA